MTDRVPKPRLRRRLFGSPMGVGTPRNRHVGIRRRKGSKSLPVERGGYS